MFYKIDSNEILEAENVEGPGFSLSEMRKDERTYPTEGWYWFENRQIALDNMPGIQPDMVLPPDSGMSIEDAPVDMMVRQNKLIKALVDR